MANFQSDNSCMFFRGTALRTVRSAVGSALVLMALMASLAGAQLVEFEPLQPAWQISCLMEYGDQVYAGLDGGGLLTWGVDDPAVAERWFAGQNISGNIVTDLVWTGEHFWVASLDGGLSRITNIDTDPESRYYTNNLGSMRITSVTGTIIGGTERVYYAMAGAGIGLITNGVSSSTYDEDSGLISNDVNALQFFQDDLFIATDLGVSRFANNVFTDQNAGLSSVVIRDLALDPDGNLLACGNGGVYRWDSDNQAWTLLGGLSVWLFELSVSGDQIWTLGRDGSGEAVLGFSTGGAFTTVDTPAPHLWSALHAGQDVWLGGKVRDESMFSALGLAHWARRSENGDYETWQIDAGLVYNTTGLAIAPDGRVWLGSHNGYAISGGLPDEPWNSVYEVATAENDSNGMFNHSGNVLGVGAGVDGLVWATQFYSGVLRHDPIQGTTEQMWPENCALDGVNVLNVVTHPAGPVFFLHDDNDAGLVDLLVDTEHWRNDANWVALPRGQGGLGNGDVCFAALVERNDVIWFAVEDVGLVRWDVNGDNAGPDDELTWLDPNDDRWDEPVSSISGSPYDPELAQSMALAPDGSIWFGGNGLVRFSYTLPSAVSLVTTHEESWGEKIAPNLDGLINGNVADVAVDANGDLWALTRSGLNRLRTRGATTHIDAWLDLGNYYANSNYPALYSYTAISPLPGMTYRRMAIDAAGRTLAVCGDQGASLVRVGASSGGTGETLAGLFVYPNPWTPGSGEEGLLKLGGFAADATNNDPALVEIYNLEGQLVFRHSKVSNETGFWNGNNRVGQPVSTGMYVVKTSWQGQIAALTLAIVR